MESLKIQQDKTSPFGRSPEGRQNSKFSAVGRDGKGQVVPLALSRTLGPLSVTLLGVGALLGGGIFTLLGHAAGLAGPALPLAILAGAVIAFLNLQTYVSLATAFHDVGGGYQWIRQGLGEFPGFLAGWVSWFAHNAACGLYAASLGFYVARLFGLEYGFWIKIITLFVIAIFGFINYRGASFLARAGNAITIALLAVIGLFVAAGAVAFAQKAAPLGNFSPFLPQGGLFVGLAGIAQAAALFYIAFEGSEIQAQSAEEVKNPEKNLKIALFSSWGIVSVIYFFVSVVIIGATLAVEPIGKFLGNAGENAILAAAGQFMPFGSALMIFGGVFANTAALNATIFSSSHVSFAMGRDKVIFPFFGKIHPVYQTPYWAVIMSLVLIGAMAVVLPITDIASAATFLFIILFFLTNLAYLQLRRKYGEAKWSYLPKGYPFAQLFVMAAYAVLAIALFEVSAIAAFITVGWIMLGVINYFAFSEPQVREDFEKEIVYERIVRLGEKKRHRILMPLMQEAKWEKFHDLAFALGRRFQSEVILLRILEISPHLPLREGVKDYGHNRRYLDQIMTKVEEENRRSRAVSEPVDVHSLMIAGRSVGRVILETVKVEDCDMLILGWDGYKRTKGTVFGSKIDEALREAKCDLLVVKGEISKVPRRILIPVPPSGNPHLRFTGKIASAVASPAGASITLCSVIPANAGGAEESAAAQALRQTRLIMKIDPSVPVELSLKKANSISKAIMEEGENHDLIIAPASRGKLFKQIRMGNIPEIVAKFSKVPVILVKGHYGILPPLLSYIKEKF